MTSITTVQKTSNLPGNGTSFSFDFSPMIIYTSTDIEVFHVVTATGVETPVLAGTGASNYSINVSSFPGTGTITYPADSGTAIPSTEAIVIKKVLPLVQPTIVASVLDEVLEEQLDKIVGMLIQQQEEIDRCLKIPITDATIINTEINTDGLRSATHVVQVDSTGKTFSTAANSSGSTGSASNATPVDVHVSSGTSGSSADFSRSDHRHSLPTSVPELAIENIFTETQIWAKGGDVASANALDLDAQAGNMWDITGTTNITSIGTIGIGTIAILQFDGALTISHNTTNLILPAGQDIITQAGDIAMFYEYASADWRLISYIHGTATNGRMPGPDFESSETSLNNDAQITFAHSLGRFPQKVEVMLRANTATAQGWANNEEGMFAFPYQGAVADDGVDVTWDATNVYITQGANIQLLDHTSFNHETITQTEYHWVVRAWA